MIDIRPKLDVPIVLLPFSFFGQTDKSANTKQKLIIKG